MTSIRIILLNIMLIIFPIKVSFLLLIDFSISSLIFAVNEPKEKQHLSCSPQKYTAIDSHYPFIAPKNQTAEFIETIPVYSKNRIIQNTLLLDPSFPFFL